MIKNAIKAVINKCGYEIRRLQPLPSGQDWVIDMQRLLSNIKAPVIFDVGANVGEVSTRLAAAFPPPARIYAFEPAESTFAQLTATCAAFTHVKSMQFALGAHVGKSSLYHGINSQLNRLAPAGQLGDGTTEEVETTTVDALAQQMGWDTIDLLKTDTEGFDVDVLNGAAGLLQRGAIRAIVSEVTFDAKSTWHTHFDAVSACLNPQGFCLYGIYDCMRWGIRLSYCNVLFLHEADFHGSGQP
jgi:FkbM family methyltransferase